MKIARRIFNRFKPQPAELGPGTVAVQGFQVDIRSGPVHGRVVAGKDCVLGCGITLEREIGRVSIGDRTYIGKGTHLICAQEITVGSDVLVAWGCTIVDHDSHSLEWAERAADVRLWREGLLAQGASGAANLKNWSVVPTAPVHIGDKAWLGFNVILLKGISIGEGAVVAAGSVVTHDVEAWSVAAGNPARKIKDIPH